MKKTIIIVILSIVFAVIILLGSLYFLPIFSPKKTPPPAPPAPPVQEAPSKPEAPVTPAWVAKVGEISKPDYMTVYISKDGHSYVSPNNKPRKAASMIKVFILATALQDYKDGKLNLDATLPLKAEDKVGGAGSLGGAATNSRWSIRTLLTKMIADSDNTATNVMIGYLGMGHINNYIKAHGYSDTILQRRMMDFAAANAGRENYTSAKDLGDIFTKIAQGQCVGPHEDEIMRSMLLKQTDTEVLPPVLHGALIAHKTGELGGVYHDGGIIYKGNSPDYVIVLMTNNYPSRGRAISDMQHYAVQVQKLLADS